MARHQRPTQQNNKPANVSLACVTMRDGRQHNVARQQSVTKTKNHDAEASDYMYVMKLCSQIQKPTSVPRSSFGASVNSSVQPIFIRMQNWHLNQCFKLNLRLLPYDAKLALQST